MGAMMMRADIVVQAGDGDERLAMTDVGQDAGSGRSELPWVVITDKTQSLLR